MKVTVWNERKATMCSSGGRPSSASMASPSVRNSSLGGDWIQRVRTRIPSRSHRRRELRGASTVRVECSGEGEGARRARPVVGDKRQLDQVEAVVAALREGAQLFVLESDARVVGQPRRGSPVPQQRPLGEAGRGGGGVGGGARRIGRSLL